MVFINCEFSLVEIYPEKELNEECSIKIQFKDKKAIGYLNFPFVEPAYVNFKMPKTEIIVDVHMQKNHVTVAKGSFNLNSHIIENNIKGWRRMVVLNIVETTRRSLFEGKFPYASFRILLNFKFPHTHSEFESCSSDCYHNPMNTGKKGKIIYDTRTQYGLPINLDKAYRQSMLIAERLLKNRRCSSLTEFLRDPQESNLKDKEKKHISMVNFLKIKKEGKKDSMVNSLNSISESVDSKYKLNRSKSNPKNAISLKQKEILDDLDIVEEKPYIKKEAKLSENNYYEYIIKKCLSALNDDLSIVSQSADFLKALVSNTDTQRSSLKKGFNDYLDKFYDITDAYSVGRTAINLRKKELKGVMAKYNEKEIDLFDVYSKYSYVKDIEYDKEELQSEQQKIKVLKKSCDIFKESACFARSLFQKYENEELKKTSIDEYKAVRKYQKKEIKRLLLGILIKNIDKLKYSRRQLSTLEFLAEKYQFVFNEEEVDDKEIKENIQPTEKKIKKADSHVKVCSKGFKKNSNVSSVNSLLISKSITKFSEPVNDEEEVLSIFDRELAKLKRRFPNIQIDTLEKLDTNTYRINTKSFRVVREGKEIRIIDDKNTVSVGNFLKKNFA